MTPEFRKTLLELQQVVRLRRECFQAACSRPGERPRDEERAWAAIRVAQLHKLLEQQLLTEEIAEMIREKLNWDAYKGSLYCERETYEPTGGSKIVMPATVKATKEPVFRILSVGPDVTDFEPGDLVCAKTSLGAYGGVFIKIDDVVGRVPKAKVPAATNEPPVDARPSGEAKPVVNDIESKKLIEDMAAAD